MGCRIDCRFCDLAVWRTIWRLKLKFEKLKTCFVGNCTNFFVDLNDALPETNIRSNCNLECAVILCLSITQSNQLWALFNIHCLCDCDNCLSWWYYVFTKMHMNTVMNITLWVSRQNSVKILTRWCFYCFYIAFSRTCKTAKTWKTIHTKIKLKRHHVVKKKKTKRKRKNQKGKLLGGVHIVTIWQI